MHGRLKAKGNRIVDSSGQPVQLKGMSLFWSQEPTGKPFYNRDVVSWLVRDWHATIVRAAIAVTGKGDGDYLSDPEGQLKLLDEVVQGAFEQGIYVLIDWHDHHAPQHLSGAKSFFDKVSQKYGDKPNVLYEIWNEPRGEEGLTWGGDLKPYAEAISKVIRAHDPDNLMIVGTPYWDQQPDAVVGNPVDDPNVAYTLHFYAGSEWHRFSGDVGKKAQAALAGGIPLFVTEWGTVHPNNDPSTFNEPETRTWMKFLDENFIGHCNWAIDSKPEGSAAIKPTASPKGGWADSDLTRSGTLVRSILRGN